jgi:multidrug efflux pump subunit AcrA (membrane-fusion protein)
VKYVLTSIIALAAMVYMGYHLYSMFKTGMTVEPVQSAEISNQLTLTGVIFRDERVVYGATSGGVVRMFSNGEKVSKNAVVAKIYDTLRTEDRTLSRIENDLSILAESNKISDTSTKNTDAKINKLYYTIRLKSEEGDYATVAEKTEELLILLNRREIIVNARLNFNTEIADLRAQREKIVSAATGEHEDVKTPVSGYFYSYADGYENVFTSEAALKLGYEDLSSLLESEAEKQSQEDGYAVGKMAQSAVWYLCMKTDRESAAGLSEGKTYPVSFPMASGSEIDFTLERIVTQNGGEGAVLVFSTSTLSADIGSARKQTVSVIQEKTVGLRVPVTAVRTNDEGEIGVFILKNDRTTFRKIQILTEQDGYCLVREFSPDEEGYSEMLHKYDNLVTSGKGLKEQKAEDDGETTEYEIRIFG